MKYRFELTNKETGEVKQFKTLEEIAELLKLDYHQVAQIHRMNDKPLKYMHHKLKLITSKYAINAIKQDLN